MTQSRNPVYWWMLLSTVLITSSFPVGAEITLKLDPAITMCLRRGGKPYSRLTLF